MTGDEWQAARANRLLSPDRRRRENNFSAGKTFSAACARDERHGHADIGRRVENFLTGFLQQFQKSRIFLSAAATEADDVDFFCNRDFFGGFNEREVVSVEAIFVRARGRMRFVQCEPFLRLLVAVVVKFVIHATRAQRRQQVAPDIFRKLTGVDGDVCRGHDQMAFSKRATNAPST